jgi:hypothetical protein
MTAPTRVTDAPFSQAEADAIRRRVKFSGSPGECPRCASPLAGNGSFSVKGGLPRILRVLRCSACRRMLVL